MRVWARAWSVAAWLPRAMSAWAWLAVLAAAEAVSTAAVFAMAAAQMASPVSMPCLLTRLTTTARPITRATRVSNRIAAVTA